jgi:hypothetical protein
VKRYCTQALFTNSDNKSERSLVSTPTHRGGDDFGKELTRHRRFGSSGLNLAFEGLVLGVSLCFCAKVTSSNPRQLGHHVHNASALHAKNVLQVVPERRSRRADRAKAHGAVWVKAVSQRRHINQHLKVAVSTSARVDISLERCVGAHKTPI